jgi:flagellar biosynthetic protein FliO
MIVRLLPVLAMAVSMAAGAAPAAQSVNPASVPAAAPATAMPGIAAPATAMPGIAAPATATPAAPDAMPAGAAVPPPSNATTTAPNTAAQPPAPLATPAGASTGSLLQTIFALIVVLALLGGVAWFLKRYGPKISGSSAQLHIVGSLNLGGRERIIVVEVGGQWIVVGASPGRVNALATMPKQDAAIEPVTLAAHQPPAASFSDWLKQTIDKRNAR